MVLSTGWLPSLQETSASSTLLWWLLEWIRCCWRFDMFLFSTFLSGSVQHDHTLHETVTINLGMIQSDFPANLTIYQSKSMKLCRTFNPHVPSPCSPASLRRITHSYWAKTHPARCFQASFRPESSSALWGLLKQKHMGYGESDHILGQFLE